MGWVSYYIERERERERESNINGCISYYLFKNSSITPLQKKKKKKNSSITPKLMGTLKCVVWIAEVPANNSVSME